LGTHTGKATERRLDGDWEAIREMVEMRYETINLAMAIAAVLVVAVAAFGVVNLLT
jgi:hypothetical protein